ncbi:MAG: sugar transferase [Ruminococcaceae bacterium]|nr:sugar transferase [Oscillospiraceae bacterium]
MQKVLVLNDYYVPAKRPTREYLFCKRALDIVVSFLMLLLLLPVLAVVAVAAAADTHGSPLFVQERMGRAGKSFRVYKFRTMSVNAPANMPTYLFNDANSYISRVGGFLRKTSLDELPQLWNILKGDMSFVGPRPVVLQETELLDLRRKNGAGIVRPGLTGLAQISGRDDVCVGLKAKFDGEYAANMSLFGDIKIFLKTFINVLRSEGVTEGGQPELATTEEKPVEKAVS